LHDAAWLKSASTQRVFAAISEGGYKVRAVGGALRNSLMGLRVSDFDLATDAHPADVARLAQAVNLAVHETGLKHGTVTVVCDSTPFEVTTLRKDVETDGRHAVVAFTDDWSADAARRDFTMNALYAEADGTIFDPLGGYADLIAQRVRFIGEPRDRIREDYLRILRFFRFSAVFGSGALDAAGLAAVAEEQEGLDSISAERIRSEVFRILLAPHAMPIIDAMATSGILARVIGSDAPRTTLARLCHLEEKLDIAPDPVRRLSALSLENPEAKTIATRLRLSNAERAALVTSKTLDVVALDKGHDIRAAIYRHGRNHVRDVALLEAARRETDASLQTVRAVVAASEPPDFPVKGEHLLQRGIEAGPKIGELLRKLEQQWIDSDFTLSRDDLLKRIP